MNKYQKVTYALERISEVLKGLIWDKAKKYGLSPIQIQILLFVSQHDASLCNVSHLAREFSITKPTVSDAIKALYQKKLIVKITSDSDSRRYHIKPSPSSFEVLDDLHSYHRTITDIVKSLDEPIVDQMIQSLTKLVFEMNKKGILEVQRTCFGCRFYQGNRKNQHHCSLLQIPLQSQQIQLDCPEHQLPSVG